MHSTAWNQYVHSHTHMESKQTCTAAYPIHFTVLNTYTRSELYGRVCWPIHAAACCMRPQYTLYREHAAALRTSMATRVAAAILPWACAVLQARAQPCGRAKHIAPVARAQLRRQHPRLHSSNSYALGGGRGALGHQLRRRFCSALLCTRRKKMNSPSSECGVKAKR